MTTFTDQLSTALFDAITLKYNENHDELGRFSESDSGGASGNGGNGGGSGSAGSSEERAKKIEQIKKDNAAVLATPLMSEGSISPMQVGQMSPTQRAKYQANAQKRMEIESQIRDLQKSDQQLSSERNAADKKVAADSVSQLTNRVEYLTRLGVGKSGKIKPTYQKEIDKANAELNAIYGKHPDLRR